MCWKCDNPNATIDEYFDELRAAIRKHGWVVQDVRKRPHPIRITRSDSTSWDLPELLITAVSPQRANRVLNTVAADSVRGTSLSRVSEHFSAGRAASRDRPSGPTRCAPGTSPGTLGAGTSGRTSWSGPTAAGAGRGPRRSATADASNRSWACRLRTRSGGTGPCSANDGRRHPVRPSPGSTRPRRRNRRSRTGTPRPAAGFPGTASMMSSGPSMPQSSVDPDRRTTAIRPLRLDAQPVEGVELQLTGRERARRSGAAARRRRSRVRYMVRPSPIIKGRPVSRNLRQPGRIGDRCRDDVVVVAGREELVGAGPRHRDSRRRTTRRRGRDPAGRRGRPAHNRDAPRWRLGCTARNCLAQLSKCALRVVTDGELALVIDVFDQS